MPVATKPALQPHELRNKRAKIYDESRELAERAIAEKRDFTADERAKMDANDVLLKTYAEDISRLERLEAHAKITTEDEFRSQVKRVSEPLPHELPSTKHEYSFRRAILGCAGGKLDGLEKEVSDEIATRVGKQPQGYFTPSRLRMRWETHRNYRVGGQRLVPAYNGYERRIDDTTAGAGAVLTRWDTTWIEYLRAKMVLDQLGPRVMNDMHGNFQMPRQSGIGTVSWVSESSSVSSTAQTIDQVTFTPKTIGAYTDMSRRFLEQLSIDPEQFVRDDLASILARGIETAVYNGTGAPQPTGILQNGSVTVISNGTNGASPTWSTIVQLEEALAKGNVDTGNLATVMTPQARATLKQTPMQGLSQTSYFPKMLWDVDSNEVNGYPAYSTNLLPSNLTKSSGSNLSALIHGNWQDAVLAFWSGMDTLVDPYTGGPAGTLRIILLQDCDFEIRHAASFAVMNDIVTV